MHVSAPDAAGGGLPSEDLPLRDTPVMTEAFRRGFRVRWGDVDFNGHMRNTAYLDTAGDVRMLFFEAHGFPMDEFSRLRIGPVVFRDEVDYSRELRLLEPYEVSLVLAGLSGNGARFRLRNEFFTGRGERAACVTSSGGWLSLETRALVPPPDDLARALGALPRSDDFETIARSAGRGGSAR